MKHKLSYSLLLSLVVLFSFNLVFAQGIGNVTIVGPTPPDDPKCLETAYCFDVVVDDLTGVTAFTIPISITGEGFDTVWCMPGTVPSVRCTVVGDTVLLGYVGPSPGMGPHTLVTICLKTSKICGALVTFAAGNKSPAGTQLFGMAPPDCDTAGTFTGHTDSLVNDFPQCGPNLDENLACCDSVAKQILATSPTCDLPLTFRQISGVGSTTASGWYTYDPACNECDFTSLVEVEVMNFCQNADTCSFTVTYDQQAPVITCPDNQNHHWAAGLQTYTASATDDACPTPHNLLFSITSADPAPTNGIGIDGATGEISYVPHCDDIGLSPITVTVRVHDGCEFDECQFTITVTNTAPTITCPDDIPMCFPHSDLIDEEFSASDPDGDPISVSILETLKDGDPAVPVPPGMSIVGPLSLYHFQWDPDVLDLGLWEISLEVDDGCQKDTCMFTIRVGKYHLRLSKGTRVLPGYHAVCTLFVTNTVEVGGFDYLITYDPSGLYFLGATPLGVAANWEYFTYRHSQQDNCGGGCPSGYIRLIGIADMYDCYDPGDVFHLEGPIVLLTFQTSQDLGFIGQCFHLRYAWFDCGDNTMSSKSGDTLFVAYDIDLFLPDENCLEGDKHTLIRCINFEDGKICIVPPEDERGDINLNGVANEIADAVLFANSFIYGWEVLGYPNDPFWENRKLATDVNNDDVPLTVADLVYLIRIITGDANPFPESGEGKIAPFANAADVSYITGEDMVVKTHSTVNVGAAAFVFRHTGYELGVPVLTDAVDEMTIRFADRDGELRVLVFSMNNNSISAGAYDLFTVPTTGEGTIELVEVQFSDAKGNMLAVNMTKVSPPSAFALMQNYPNPFNAGTVIRFALPDASDWSLKIYNVVGQLVREFKGQAEAGLVSVHWDATNAASGIYFYKLTADKFTDTKKMILMK